MGHTRRSPALLTPAQVGDGRRRAVRRSGLSQDRSCDWQLRRRRWVRGLELGFTKCSSLHGTRWPRPLQASRSELALHLGRRQRHRQVPGTRPCFSLVPARAQRPAGKGPPSPKFRISGPRIEGGRGARRQRRRWRDGYGAFGALTLILISSALGVRGERRAMSATARGLTSPIPGANACGPRASSYRVLDARPRRPHAAHPPEACILNTY